MDITPVDHSELHIDWATGAVRLPDGVTFDGSLTRSDLLACASTRSGRTHDGAPGYRHFVIEAGRLGGHELRASLCFYRETLLYAEFYAILDPNGPTSYADASLETEAQTKRFHEAPPRPDSRRRAPRRATSVPQAAGIAAGAGLPPFPYVPVGQRRVVSRRAIADDRDPRGVRRPAGRGERGVSAGPGAGRLKVRPPAACDKTVVRAYSCRPGFVPPKQHHRVTAGVVQGFDRGRRLGLPGECARVARGTTWLKASAAR